MAPFLRRIGVLLFRKVSMHPGIAVMIHQIRSILLTLRTNCSGVTAIEYGLILAIISILTVAWATTVGKTLCGFFTSVNNGF
jgi:Flp pilus assembly pilin Flp